MCSHTKEQFDKTTGNKVKAKEHWLDRIEIRSGDIIVVMVLCLVLGIIWGMIIWG